MRKLSAQDIAQAIVDFAEELNADAHTLRTGESFVERMIRTDEIKIKVRTLRELTGRITESNK